MTQMGMLRRKISFLQRGFLLLWLMPLCIGEDCHAQYKVKSVCDKSYGSPLNIYTDKRSVVECAVTCNKDVMCRSALFNRSKRKCRTNSETMDGSVANCSKKLTYILLDIFEGPCFSIDCATTTNTAEVTSTQLPEDGTVYPPGSIFSYCVDDSDCEAISGAECRQSECQCVPGLSHDPNSNICVSGCFEYGATFQEDQNHYLQIPGEKMIGGINSESECIVLCIEETSFVCRTAQYYWPNLICSLYVDTAYTQPNSYTSSVSYNLYQRDCALSGTIAPTETPTSPFTKTSGLPGGIFSYCTNDFECEEITDAECRSGKCQCIAGLSHNPPTNACIPNCLKYGATFQEHLNHYLSISSNKMIGSIPSPSQCMDECISETEFICRTAEFYKPNSICSLYDTVSPESYTTSVRYNLYERDCAPSNTEASSTPFSSSPPASTQPSTSVGSIFSYCINHIDCSPIHNAECRHEKCQCVPGLSYDPNVNTCAIDCIHYGTTFQEDFDHYLQITAEKIIGSIADPIHCMDLCITETSFECRTAEYYKPNSICSLYVDTAYTQSGSHTSSVSYNLYQRDCALETAIPPSSSTEAPYSTIIIPPPSTTQAPYSTTIVPPPSSTEAPYSTTIILLPSSTEAPYSTTIIPPPSNTEEPYSTTIVPTSSSTEAPYSTTIIPPPSSTEAPYSTTIIPAPSSTEAPYSTTIIPPPSSTAAPYSTTIIPPPSSTEAPYSTTIIPPPSSTAAPYSTTIIPPPSSTEAPYSTIIIPPPSSTEAPYFTTIIPPPSSTAAPYSIIIIPPPSSTEAPYSTTIIPPPSSTAAPYSTTLSSGTIFDYCTSSQDCAEINNAICRFNKCQCTIGLSHNPSTNACVIDCATYGTTFQEDAGYFLDGFNDRIFNDAPDATHCKNLCIEETEFVCRTAEYFDGGTCYLSVVTAHMEPESRTPSASYTTYQRDCE